MSAGTFQLLLVLLRPFSATRDILRIVRIYKETGIGSGMVGSYGYGHFPIINIQECKVFLIGLQAVLVHEIFLFVLEVNYFTFTLVFLSLTLVYFFGLIF